MTADKIYFHVRHANGVTVDWLTDRETAIGLAKLEGAQAYEVNHVTGRAVRIA